MEFFDTNDLRDGEIFLRLRETREAVPEKGYVPAYHFDICLADGTKAGACSLRVGHSPKLYIGGNIGYEVDAAFRGHRYAAKACRLLFRLAVKHALGYLFITCDPDNYASARTCEIAGGIYQDTADIPEDDDLYAAGKRKVRIYRFSLGPAVFWLPGPAELSFRQALLADPATMAYNHAYGGCIAFPPEVWADWYARWTARNDENHFYRYLADPVTGEFVGEAAYHYDEARGIWLADVIVAAEKRGQGCGTEGLRLLEQAAKSRGINALFDEIAADNEAGLALFRKNGYREVSGNRETVLLKKNL